MTKAPVYPGMVAPLESMIVNALSFPTLLQSRASVVLSKVTSDSHVVDIYLEDYLNTRDFKDDANSFSIVDYIDESIQELTFWEQDIRVRARDFHLIDFSTLDEVLDAGLYPLFVASGALEVSESAIRDRLPWMFRSSGVVESTSNVVESSGLNDTGVQNIAVMVGRAVSLGVDLSGVRRVDLRTNEEPNVIEFRVTPEPGQSEAASRAAGVIRQRLSTRTELRERWEWRVTVGDDGVEPWQWDRYSTRRLLLSTWNWGTTEDAPDTST